jgi:hypothetical protein
MRKKTIGATDKNANISRLSGALSSGWSGGKTGIGRLRTTAAARPQKRRRKTLSPARLSF